jgi:hypothetical protein
MSRLPGVDEKWLDVRVEMRKGLIRGWVDDRLIATEGRSGAGPRGVSEDVPLAGVQTRVVLGRGAGADARIRADPPRRLREFARLARNAAVDPSSLPPAQSNRECRRRAVRVRGHEPGRE